MSITIKELAQLAGTSRGTVDRVLNNRGNVNKDLAKLIIKLAKENNYRPNTMAKMLIASQNKFKIGVIINSIGNIFYQEVLEGIKKAQYQWQNNFELIIREIEGYNSNDFINAIEELEEIGISAIAITPVENNDLTIKINSLKDKGILVALINSDSLNCERFVVVEADNTENGMMAGSLVSLYSNHNHLTRVAIITGSNQNIGNKLRVDGFTKAINECENNIQIVEIAENQDNDKKSNEVVESILNNHKDLDLIYFCAGGIKGGLEAIEQLQSNVKVITVDMIDVVKEKINEGKILATITQNPFKQGYKPIAILVEKLLFGKNPKNTKIFTENKVIVKYNNEINTHAIA